MDEKNMRHRMKRTREKPADTKTIHERWTDTSRDPRGSLEPFWSNRGT